MILSAVKENGLALEFVSLEKRNPEIIKTALKSNPKAIEYIKPITDNEYIFSVLHAYPKAFTYIKNTNR